MMGTVVMKLIAEEINLEDRCQLCPQLIERKGNEVQKLICKVECTKAQLKKPSGKETYYPEDDQFFYLGSHVDKSVQEKIKKGKVDIDFAKLISKKKTKDEDKLDIVSRGGKSYVLPTLEKDVLVIGSFKKWEQVFSIFCSIYTSSFSDRTSQLF